MLAFWLAVLVVSLLTLAWFSDKAFDTAAALALLLNMSPLIIGAVLLLPGAIIAPYF